MIMLEIHKTMKHMIKSLKNW